MLEIDETIGRVEDLYRAITGKPFPDAGAPYAPIPQGVDPNAHVEKELDRLVAALAAPVQAWRPSFAIVEAPTEIVVQFDVPGVAREGIAVSLEGGLLIVEGRRAAPRSNGDRVFGDRPSGAFRRPVVLPPGLDLDKMSARLVDGVLEVRIPRIANGESKTIPIA